MHPGQQRICRTWNVHVLPVDMANSDTTRRFPLPLWKTINFEMMVTLNTTPGAYSPSLSGITIHVWKAIWQCHKLSETLRSIWRQEMWSSFLLNNQTGYTVRKLWLCTQCYTPERVYLPDDLLYPRSSPRHHWITSVNHLLMEHEDEADPPSRLGTHSWSRILFEHCQIFQQRNDIRKSSIQKTTGKMQWLAIVVVGEETACWSTE